MLALCTTGAACGGDINSSGGNDSVADNGGNGSNNTPDSGAIDFTEEPNALSGPCTVTMAPDVGNPKE